MENKKVKIYCKNPECFKHYLVNNKIIEKKIIKAKVSKKDQEEMNELRIKLGFKPEPIKEEFEIECLFG